MFAAAVQGVWGNGYGSLLFNGATIYSVLERIVVLRYV